MPTFKNMRELNSYLNTQRGSMSTNRGNVVEIMKQEAAKLEGMIKANILSYYSSYQPKVYSPRTYDWINSLKVAPPMVMGDTIVMSIYFDETLGMHPSVMKNGDDGYVPILFELGWSWHRASGAYRFGHFEGIHYVFDAIEEYKKTNPYGLIPVAFFNGERLY